MRNKITENDIRCFLTETPCTVNESNIIRKFVEFNNSEKLTECNCSLCEGLRKKYSSKGI